MRSLAVTFALFLTVACSEKQPASGWDYRPAHGAYSARLFYRFADSDRTTLIGSCSGEPSFVVTGGAWNGSQFTLTVDGKSWNLPTAKGEHGHYLRVDREDPNQAIADAKLSIVFEVGNWRREIVPGAALESFVKDCGL